MDPWRTSIVDAGPEHIRVKGYDVLDLMQRSSFTDLIFLLHHERLPSAGERRLVDAILIGVADHGAGAPSCAAARLAASGNRASLSAAVAAGLLTIGDEHGGAGSGCMELIASGLARAADSGMTLTAVAHALVEDAKASGSRVPGFGHRVHSTIDPRVAVLFGLAEESGLAGNGIRFARALEDAIRDRIKPIPLNIDGALAAILVDLGFPPPVGRLLFIIGRVAGLSAEVLEEHTREKPMRIKIPVTYDGVADRQAEADPTESAGRNSHRMAVAVSATRSITPEEQATARLLIERARAAMAAIADYDQATVDRLCQAIAWAGGNEQTAIKLANMSVDESGMGSREPKRRAKVLGILRDALRQKSMGVIEEIPDKGIVKYAKPAGVITALIPVTSPYVTPIGIAIYALKCKDAVIFSPHPGSRKTTNETVRVMRAALRKQGIPEDVLQCVERPSIPLANELMATADLTMATGGPAMVKAAYGSGKPAYGVGAGNATMVIDETANVDEAARNTRISKTNDHGSGCSADGNLIVDASIYDAMLTQLQLEGGYLVNEQEKTLLERAYWDESGHRTPDTIARPAAAVAAKAGFAIPDDKTFLLVEERHIGKQHRFSTEKLGTVLAIFKYEGFDTALDMVRRIFETGGKGHSCGIYSFDDDHIHRLALVAPVSRIMVRQVQSASNAGTFTNGMPMTSSMGCGVWGGNITNENISLKHYMNVTWVSRPMPEDRPSEQELFGEFFNSEVF